MLVGLSLERATLASRAGILLSALSAESALLLLVVVERAAFRCGHSESVTATSRSLARCC